MMNAKKVLDVQQIQKNFGKVQALRNVTFSSKPWWSFRIYWAQWCGKNDDNSGDFGDY